MSLPKTFRKRDDEPNEPKLETALALLARILAPFLVAELSKGAPTLEPYSQAPGERPAGCGPAKYARTWRAAWAAGDPGATKNGRARLLTREAYERHAPSERPAPPAPTAKPIERSDDEHALEALGLRRAS